MEGHLGYTSHVEWCGTTAVLTTYYVQDTVRWFA